MTGFDSLALDTDKPTKMTLNHPKTNSPLVDAQGQMAFILLYGMDSEAAQKAKKDATTRNLRRRNRSTLTADELEANNVEFLVALTAGWHLVNPAGEAVDHPFSAANARQLYANPKMSWIREQVDEFVGDRGNFLNTSSQTSVNGSATAQA